MSAIEIINGAFNVYLAPEEEPYPEINETIAGNWALIGTNGKRHYSEEGVVVNYEQEFTEHSGAGGTEILKVSRTLERCRYVFELFDMVAAQFVKGFNLGTSPALVTTAATATTGGHSSISILRGLDVTQMALLIRGENLSPDLLTENIQIQVPSVVQIGNIESVHNKDAKAGHAYNLQAIANYAYTGIGDGSPGLAAYGNHIIGTAAPTG